MIGNHIILLPTVDSTNNYAAKLIEEGKMQPGTVILAERQTDGRGQRGNSWQSESGKQFTTSILISTAFLSVELLPVFNMAVSLSVFQTVKELTNKNVEIKWPNDIIINGKKCGGILIETQFRKNRIDNAIVGIGLNLHNESDLPNAIALSDVLEQVPEPLSVLDALLPWMNFYDRQLRAGDFNSIKEEYHKHLWRLGFEQQVETTEGKVLYGKITGVSDAGDLQFETVDELYNFSLKDVKFTY